MIYVGFKRILLVSAKLYVLLSEGALKCKHELLWNWVLIADRLRFNLKLDEQRFNKEYPVRFV